jgi:hypothetical protein
MKNKLLLITLIILYSALSYSQVEVQAIKIGDSFDPKSSVFLETAIQELKQVFNSEEFKLTVLNESFKVGNYELSSLEIFELILSGKDNYINKPEDNSIDIRVKVFDKYAGSENFGFTDMNTRITRTHRCYIFYNSQKCYTSHLAHEYMHQIGFYDKRTWLFGKKTESVPYKIGRIIDRLIENDAKCSAKKTTCSN